jgi:1,2-diacylglycerol 3-alpha-glucosyltransferase
VVLPSEKARSFCQFVTLKKRLVVIPNGIDPERYQKTLSPEEKAALFRKYHLTDNGFTMVMVTRVSREKNIQEILNFFPSLLQVIPQAQLLIAGDGPELKKLTAWCEKNGLDGCIRFIGRIPPEDVYQIYGMGDLYVSASDFEVHSISYLEAMACGLPLLCRYDISLKGMLRIGRNGYIYRTKQEFLKYAVEILKNPALQETMHKNALITAKKFSNERFTDRTLAFYADVLSHYSIPQAHPSK